MTVFGQLGDPVAGAGECLCQHHGAAYSGRETIDVPLGRNVVYDSIADGGTIVQVQIITTERCCIVVNAALMTLVYNPPTDFEIERPLGAIRTTQEDAVPFGSGNLLHHAAWEVLDPGTYTYYLVNRAGAARSIIAAWIKAVASDCEG